MVNHFFVIKALAAGGRPAGGGVLPDAAVADGGNEPPLPVQQQAGPRARPLHLLLDDGAGVVPGHEQPVNLIILGVVCLGVAVLGLQPEFFPAVGLDNHGIAIRLSVKRAGDGYAQLPAAPVDRLLVVEGVQRLGRGDEEITRLGKALPLLRHGAEGGRPRAEQHRMAVSLQQGVQPVRVVRIGGGAVQPAGFGHIAGGKYRRLQGAVPPALDGDDPPPRPAQHPGGGDGGAVFPVGDNHSAHNTPPYI